MLTARHLLIFARSLRSAAFLSKESVLYNLRLSGGGMVSFLKTSSVARCELR